MEKTLVQCHKPFCKNMVEGVYRHTKRICFDCKKKYNQDYNRDYRREQARIKRERAV